MVRLNGKLEKATWDQALDVVAEKLKSMDNGSLAALASSRGAVTGSNA